MSDNERKPIIIVGGGIGGLSAAIALRRAGFEAQVFERAPELREVGAGISIWPNASRILRRWGVLDAVVRRGFPLTRGELKSWNGRVLHRMAFEAADAPGLLIHRADLHAALAAALPPWAVQTDAEFERYEETPGGVRAWFAGLGEADGAALVGADGLRSAVRRQVLGDGAPVYRGYPVWRGVARVGGAPGCDVLTESLGAGLRFGVVPIGGGRVAWWATANEPQGTDDGPSPRAKLMRLFGAWHHPVPLLIDATPECEILKNDTCDRPPVRGWGRGRVTLLGDAAHPTTPNLGQGGCMAIEDAAVLAASLVRRPDDLPSALRDFERRRYGRTTWITRQSLRYGRIAQWASPAAVRLRDLLYRLTPQAATDLTISRILAFDG